MNVTVTPKRVVAALLAAAGLVVLLAAVTAWLMWNSSGQKLHGDPVVVNWTMEPQQVMFGDPIRVLVEVAVDRSRIDPATVTVDAAFTPYRELRAAKRTRQDTGGVTKLGFDYLVDCTTAACLPKAEGRVDFKPATVTYRARRSTQPTSTTIEWPPIRTVPRIPAKRLWSAGLRGDVRDLKPPTYRVSPRTVEVTGLLLAVLFALAGSILAIRLLPLDRIVARLGGGDPRTPLERALALVHESTGNGHPEEGRRALERLAHELRQAHNPDLARQASRLAWSQRNPGDARLEPLSKEVERVIAEAS